MYGNVVSVMLSEKLEDISLDRVTHLREMYSS